MLQLQGLVPGPGLGQGLSLVQGQGQGQGLAQGQGLTQGQGLAPGQGQGLAPAAVSNLLSRQSTRSSIASYNSGVSRTSTPNTINTTNTHAVAYKREVVSVAEALTHTMPIVQVTTSTTIATLLQLLLL